jgi:hypothetical protein
MTAAGAGAAAGVSWIDVAASAAGIYHQMAAVGQQAASGFSQAFNSEWAGRAQSAMKLGGNVTGDFAALGTEAANTFVGQFTRVLQGGVPDPKAFFDLFEHGIDDMVNDVVAKVPLIGPAFQKAYSVVQPIVDSFVGITGEMGQAVEELGAQWMEMSRTFAENTVDAEGLARLMTVTQQIAESGAVVSLKDVSESIGLINQRIQGLNNDQLRELTTTVALADEVFHGAGPNVNYLTQALNAFDIAAADANMTTIELVNASRASGQPINQMLMAMIQLGPAFRQMGYDAEQSAMFLGDMSKAGEPLARIAFAFNDVVTSFQKHGITDTHAAWTELIDTMRADVLAGHDELASQLAAKYTITPRAITMLIDAMHKGEPLLPEELTAAQPLGNLHTSIEDIIDKTRTLRDAWMQISNILQGVLAPLGVGLESGLITMTDHVRDWLETNKQQIISWAGQIGHWVLTGIGDLAGAVSSAIKAVEPILNAIFKTTISIVGGVVEAIHLALQAATHLPFIGHDFVDAANASGDIASKLKTISEFNFAGNTEKFADMLSHIANDSVPELDRKFQEFVAHQKVSLAIQDAITTKFAAPGQEAATPQPIFSPEIEHGLSTLTKDPKAIQDVIDKLSNLGIHMQVDPEGHVTQFTTRTEHEAEELRKYLEATFGEEAWKELSPKLSITVVEHPPMTPEEARRKVGLPDEIDVPVRALTPDNLPGILGVPGQPVPPGSVQAPGGTPPPIEIMPGVPLPGQPPGSVPAPGGTPPPIEIAPGVPLPVHPSGYVQIPGQVTIQPASLPGDMRQILDSAGVPEGTKSADGVVIPAGLDVKTPTNLTADALMDRAGVPYRYQGDVQGASPGITLPTGLDVKDAPDQKSVGDVMEAVGIPYKNQGQDGVVLDVSFNMPFGGGGGSGGGPGLASVSDAALLANVQPGRYVSEPGVGDLAKGIGDCSSAVEDLVDILEGRPTGGRSLSTSNADQWLTDHGFIPGMGGPGDFRVGFNASHMQATLPGGTPFNWGSNEAAARGGVGGTGAFDPAFTSHYYRPVGGGGGGPSLYGPENINAALNNPAGGAGSVDWEGIAKYESGGDWSITHGEGPDVTGGLQIATATWLSHGGGAYARKAYMASKAEQIAVAQRILADPAQGPTAWPTTYRDHPELFGGQPLLTAQSGGPIYDPGGIDNPTHFIDRYLESQYGSDRTFMGFAGVGDPMHNQEGGEIGPTWDQPSPLLTGLYNFLKNSYLTVRSGVRKGTGLAGQPDPLAGSLFDRTGRTLQSGVATGWRNFWQTGVPWKHFQHGGSIGDPLVPMPVDPHVLGMQQLAQSMGGVPYALGGTGGGGIDCSALVGKVIADYLGEAAPGHGVGAGTMYTGNEGSWLAARGFKPGVGPAGSIQVGFENYSAGGGHTVLRLPNGVAVEASSRSAPGLPNGGVRYGGDAKSPTDSMFTDKWYLIPTAKLQSGGHVEGQWWPGRDSVPMDLPAGTFVVNRLMSQKHRGLLDQMSGGGGGGGPMVPTLLEVGERLVPPGVAARNLPLLHAVNSGMLGMQYGGELPPPPVPVKPNVGDYYGIQDPKTAMQALGTGGLPPGTDLSKLPPFTPGQPPFNPYTNPPPWPMTQKDQQDFKRSFDQWLISMGDLGDSLKNAQDQQTRANDQKQKADDALTKAQTDLGDFLNQQHLAADKDYDESDPNSKISQLRRKVADSLTRQREAADAQTRASRGITSAQQREYISGETPPPEAPGMKEALKGQQITPDEKAAQLGAGLVKGVFQELGFPDVFGKAFTNWGVWKLGMGGLGYGMGLLDAMSNPQQGGGGGGQPSGLLGLFSGLSKGLGGSPFKPQPPGSVQTNLFGGPTGPAPGPGGAPPPASDTAGVPQSQTPVNQPPGAAPASYGGPGLVVNYNPQGLNVLGQPQVTAGITDALHQTGAPQLVGGQGLP